MTPLLRPLAGLALRTGRRPTHAGPALGLALLLALGACGGGGGDGGDAGGNEPLPNGDQPFTDRTAYSSQPGASLASAEEGTATTHHTLTLNGSAIAYTAKAGHLTASDLATGQPKASFFYVAYTADNQAAATRPLTFFYNGGPGSASVWLHLGSFGPKRLVTGIPGTTAATPFPLVDNAESLLDTTDLVFVDAVGSGLSQAIAPNTNATLWGVDADAAAFRDFIRRYVGVNGRAASPTYLFGESYGTARSAVLANLMALGGQPLAGVVLQSAVLDYNSNCGVVEVISTSCEGYLPTYSAIGSYYNLVNPPRSVLSVFMQEMRDYTVASYAPAVGALLSAGTPPAAHLPPELNSRTGIATSLWQSRFNLDPGSFQYNLLPSALIGRYDGRVSAPFASPLAREGDPSSTVIGASFASAIDSHLRDTLRYTASSTYVLLSDAIASWNFTHDGLPLPDTVPDLASAMLLNPALQVFAVSGYHDLATPFYTTELDLARLGASPQVHLRNYAGGHMTYLDDTSRALQKADLRAFYQGSLVLRTAAAAAKGGL
ncbi:MAG TPA: peptidase S10 [Ideonella sp.]|nr:peptidase S10 [Ideonella sp.]